MSHSGQCRQPLRAIFMLSLGVLSLLPNWVSGQEVAEFIPGSECTIPALTQDELVAAATGTPSLSRSELVDLEAGTPADAETVASITETVRFSVACANANAPMRSLSLFTAAYLLERFGGEDQDDLGHLIASISRTPGPVENNDLLGFVAVRDVVTLVDGRVLAVVETVNGSARFVDTLLFIEVSGEWFIDQVIPESTGGTPEAGA